MIVKFICLVRNLRHKVKYIHVKLSISRGLLTPQLRGVFWRSCCFCLFILRVVLTTTWSMAIGPQSRQSQEHGQSFWDRRSISQYLRLFGFITPTEGQYYRHCPYKLVANLSQFKLTRLNSRCGVYDPILGVIFPKTINPLLSTSRVRVFILPSPNLSSPFARVLHFHPHEVVAP